MKRERKSSFFCEITPPRGLTATQRELLTQLVVRAARPFSFLGMEDWSVQLGSRPKVLGIAEEFHDLSGYERKNPSRMKIYFGRKHDGARFAAVLRQVLADVRVGKVREAKPQDWMRAWRKHYRPVSLGGGALWIYPAWIAVPRARRSRTVRIYPGQAFGTGTHETTQLCLEAFLDAAEKRPLKRVLDFGAGTGILSLAALRIAPGLRAEAVEIDPVACEQLKKNARINRARLPVRRKLGPVKKYDLIFANVLAPLLLSFRDELLERLAEGGVLILSGILAKEVKVFVEEFTRGAGFGAARVEVRTKKDWAVVVIGRGE